MSNGACVWPRTSTSFRRQNSSAKETLQRSVNFEIAHTPPEIIQRIWQVRVRKNAVVVLHGRGAFVLQYLHISIFSSHCRVLEPFYRASGENERAEANEPDPTTPSIGGINSRARADPSESVRVRVLCVVPMHWNSHARPKSKEWVHGVVVNTSLSPGYVASAYIPELDEVWESLWNCYVEVR